MCNSKKVNNTKKISKRLLCASKGNVILSESFQAEVCGGYSYNEQKKQANDTVPYTYGE